MKYAISKHLKSRSFLRDTRRYAFAAILVVLTIAIYISNSRSINHVVALASTHQPETYTELYFVSPNTLPAHVAQGVVSKFSFGVTSHQSNATNYGYEITDTTPDGVSVVTRGSLILQNSGTEQKTVNFTIAKANTSALIQISLVGTNKKISFWSQS